MQIGLYLCFGWRALRHLERCLVPVPLPAGCGAADPPHGGAKSSQQRQRDSSRDFGNKDERDCGLTLKFFFFY